MRTVPTLGLVPHLWWRLLMALAIWKACFLLDEKGPCGRQMSARKIGIEPVLPSWLVVSFP
jgi:hypothetical protein